MVKTVLTVSWAFKKNFPFKKLKRQKRKKLMSTLSSGPDYAVEKKEQIMWFANKTRFRRELQSQVKCINANL